MRMRGICRAPVLGMTILACSPGSNESAGAIVQDSSGVAIVASSGTDKSVGLSLVHVVDLEPPDSSLTPVPWGVAADSRTGRIYAVDWTAPRVVVFDADGEFEGEYGRLGSGPGEFRNPVALTLEEDGRLAVWDAGRSTISRWSPQGTLLGEERAPADYWGPGFGVASGTLFTVTTQGPPSGMVMVQRLVATSSSSTRSIYELPVELTMMELPGISTPAPRVFSPSILWTSRGGDVYVLSGPRYQVDRYDQNGLVASYRRDVEPLRVTPEMAVASVENGSGPYQGFLRRLSITPDQLVRAVGHEPLVSPVQNLALDTEGRLWVTRTTDGVRPSATDLLGVDGEYLGTLATPGIPSAFISDSLVVVLRVEETGRTVLGLYRLKSDLTGEDDQTLPQALNEFRDCPNCPVMIELPPGRFVMGSAAGEEAAAGNAERPDFTIEAEKPQVEVEIAYSLAVGKYEVTFAEWDYCIEMGGCTYRPDDEGWGRADRPVMNLSRGDTRQYLDWLREHTGEEYRLPSEAEWEYAARAGTTTARYWGDLVGTDNAVCDGCGSEWDKGSTAPVGTFAPNSFGLYNMLDNVYEWVADCWHPTHLGQPGDGSARIEDSPWWKDGVCERPARRSAGWAAFPWVVRAAYRGSWRPGPWSDREASYGFRVVRTMTSKSLSPLSASEVGS